ncbi:MAG: hypothetical protein ABSA18_16420 [Dehalococcoidia bacterium]|jgi:hypothetical protein
MPLSGSTRVGLLTALEMMAIDADMDPGVIGLSTTLMVQLAKGLKCTSGAGVRDDVELSNYFLISLHL